VTRLGSRLAMDIRGTMAVPALVVGTARAGLTMRDASWGGASDCGWDAWEPSACCVGLVPREAVYQPVMVCSGPCADPVWHEPCDSFRPSAPWERTSRPALRRILHNFITFSPHKRNKLFVLLSYSSSMMVTSADDDGRVGPLALMGWWAV
jgi:hypothetical protein